MKKDDLNIMLKEVSTMIETHEFTHLRISQLWVQINCLKQTVEDIISKNKPKTTDNERSTG